MSAKENKKANKTCEDKKCPFHGDTTIKGRTFTGVVIAKDIHGSATVEWSYKLSVPKYERQETRRTKVRVHNPPCIDAKVGDIVKISQTRPLSKTKNFVITENLGKEKGFEVKVEAAAEAQEIIEAKERKEEVAEKESEPEEAKKE